MSYISPWGALCTVCDIHVHTCRLVMIWESNRLSRVLFFEAFYVTLNAMYINCTPCEKLG